MSERRLLAQALELAELAWSRTDDDHMEGLAFNLRNQLREVFRQCLCPLSVGGGNADDICGITLGQCPANRKARPGDLGSMNAAQT